MPLEKLHGAFVLLGGFAAVEGAEVAALVRLRIRFARVEPVLAGLQFSNHRGSFRFACRPGGPARCRDRSACRVRDRRTRLRLDSSNLSDRNRGPRVPASALRNVSRSSVNFVLTSFKPSYAVGYVLP